MSSSVDERIVVTGIGLASPNGNSLGEFRDSLLGGRSGVVAYETRYMGDVLAGVCDFDVLAHQGRREVRRGTRSGSIAIYCAHEAVADAGLDLDDRDKSRTVSYTHLTLPTSDLV